MKLRYKIEDLEACDFVVDFEFGRDTDNEIYFLWAYDVLDVEEFSFENNKESSIKREVLENDYKLINHWLYKFGDDIILRLARKEF